MNNHENLYNSIEQMLILLGIDNKEELSPEDLKRLELTRQTKNFLDKFPGGFFIYRADESEQIIYANKAMLKIFGCDDLAQFRTFTGNSFKGIVHPDDLASVENSIKEQISQSQEDLDYVEYRIIRKDGEVRWVEDYGHFAHSEIAGDVFYVFISDATERINRQLSEKNALIDAQNEKEQKLQHLIEKYNRERSLFQQEDLQRLKVIEGLSINYDSILFADLDEDTVLPYRLSYRTQHHFEKKLQIRKFTELMKDYASTWVHPDDRELVSKMTVNDYIRKELSENDSFYINYRCIENDTTKYLQLRIVNVGSKSKISQIVLGYRTIDDEILHEIKQKSVLEDALHKANLASVAKNTFLSNMSHDMRTPLNAIFGYTALAGKNLKDKELVSDYLEKIEAASRQILDLINNVLELTYMESQNFRLNETECNVCEIVQEIQRSLLPKAVQKNISLSLQSNTMNSGVYADKEKLKQVLHHLADNAVKYTKNGGQVNISVTELKKDKLSKGFSTYEFTVKDTGVGIGKNALEHIFEPFERENNTTQAGIYGLGLGLTIAKHIIDTMGGTITAESEVGKGSTFKVTLELRKQNYDHRTEQEQSARSFSLKGKKILIVEDNPINLEIEAELLSDLGCTIDSAQNGQIAVEKVSASKDGEYFLILMDIQMPVMDGLQATEAIRKLDNPAHAKLPIIAVSANAFESDKKASIEAGMDAHLTKPINIPLLLKTIKQTVKNK